MSDAQRTIRRLLVTMLALSLASVIGLTLRHRRVVASAHSEYQGAAVLAVEGAATRVQRKLQEATRADRVAAALASGHVGSAAELESLLRGATSDVVTSIVVIFASGRSPEYFPERPDAALELAALRGGAEEMTFESYSQGDVDAAEEDVMACYRAPTRAGRPTWTDAPYLSPLDGEWISGGYGVPFTVKGTEITGVVHAALSVRRLRREVYAVLSEKTRGFPVESSHAFIVSSSGRFLSHPDGTLVSQRHGIAEFDPRLPDEPSIHELPRVASPAGGVRILRDHVERGTGQRTTVFFDELERSGWWIAVALDDSEALRALGVAERIETSAVLQSVAHVVFLSLLAALLFRAYLGDEWRLWALSAAVALCTLLGTCALWYLHVSGDTGRDERDILVLSTAVPQKLEMLVESRRGSRPIAVPTGVFLQSIEFSSANDVTVTGYVWQRYDHTVPRSAWLEPNEVGFVLPEAELTKVSTALERRTEEEHHVVWYVTAVLRQEFDYSHYPFDSEVVWLRLWHSRLGAGIVLTPDLGEYDDLTPSSLPGVERPDQGGFVLEGWRLDRSFFSYRLNGYDTSFGLGRDFVGRDESPELYFNVGMSRAILNPFITYLFPLSVVIVLLFAALSTVRGQESAAKRFGYSAWSVLGFAAALFFVVIVSHGNLRSSLDSERVVYLEHFYFATYAAILAVAVNSLCLASTSPPRWLAHRDNLITRLLFWPSLLTALWVLTLRAFS